MKHCTYATSGTCSKMIEFDIDEQGRLHNVSFLGGCPGNTHGIALMAEGMDAAALAERLQGVPCRDKNTSCPDQLSRAIRENL